MHTVVAARRFLKQIRDRNSLPGNEVVVVSGDDDDSDNADLNKYVKPVSLYMELESRSKNNPCFLRRCLNYIIKAKKETELNSGETIRFNYRDMRNTKTLRTQDVKNFSCPFCVRSCGGHEGLRLHLLSSHDVFEYNFNWVGEDGREIDVYLKRDTLRFQVQTCDIPQLNTFIFCSKHRKERRERDASSSVKRLNARFLELDIDELPRLTENESTPVNNDNVSSPPRAHSLEMTTDIITTTQPATAAASERMVTRTSGRRKLFAMSSEPKVTRASGRKKSVAESSRSEPKVTPISRRKKASAERALTISKAKGIERLKSRQFYHSHTMQPMTFEEVMSNVDSENEADDEALDLHERLRFEHAKGLTKEEKRYMYLWNIFLRKQRIIADKHVPWACEEFTKLHKEEMRASESFDWWWRMFRITLWDRRLICAKTFNNCTTIFLSSDEAGPSTSHGPATNDTAQQSMEVDA